MGDTTPPLSSERGFVAASIDGAGLLEGDTFVTVNEKLTTIYGFDDADALVGTAWTDRYPAAERERIETEVLPRVRDGRGWRGEARGVRADGTTLSHVLSIQRSGSDGYVWVVRERDGGTAENRAIAHFASQIFQSSPSIRSSTRISVRRSSPSESTSTRTNSTIAVPPSFSTTPTFSRLRETPSNRETASFE